MKEKVNVTGLPETMIQTLYARAKESGKENAKIHDDMAVEMVSRLDYDFSKADQDKAMSYGVIARTIVLDEMVEKYLSGHPNTIVVNIASGLDTRCYRMQGKYGYHRGTFHVSERSRCAADDVYYRENVPKSDGND